MDSAIQNTEYLREVLNRKSKAYFFLKRIMDIIIALIGIVVLSPVMLVVAVWIKIDSRGPVIFKQSRCGKNAVEFNMYKFRSMCREAEGLKEKLTDRNETDGPVFKIKNDPRITKIGKFIRQTSIDEIPQLFNVLRGHMSIVGPRPPVPKEVAQYNAHQRQRLLIKPGMTCYWQVMGRSKIGFDRWVELDLRYIQECSLWVDIKILLLTFPAILRKEGAW